MRSVVSRALAIAGACSLLAYGVVRAQQADTHNSASFPSGHYAQLDALPDWGGIWFLTRSSTRNSTPQPKLKGVYLAAHKKWQSEVASRNGQTAKSRSNCSPPGMPRIMRLAQYPYEFIFSPGRVTMNQEAWMQTRTIWTDGRAHPEDPDPSFMGHSVGHWEGDTLVIDTVGILAALEIEPGYRHSDKLQITERIHLAPGDPNTLVDEIRLTDPAALEEAFS
ncbi:MAG: hypothetical protein ABIO26_03910, partial [Croceibacterium sp.]